MAGFENTDGTWAALLVTAGLAAAGAMAKGSRATGGLVVTQQTEAGTIAEAFGWGQEIVYQLTPGEKGALDWIGGRYVVVDVLNANLDDNNLLRLDSDAQHELARALADEGIDRVPSLSDDTVLQRIVWSIGPWEGESEGSGARVVDAQLVRALTPALGPVRKQARDLGASDVSDALLADGVFGIVSAAGWSRDQIIEDPFGAVREYRDVQAYRQGASELQGY